MYKASSKARTRPGKATLNTNAYLPCQLDLYKAAAHTLAAARKAAVDTHSSSAPEVAVEALCLRSTQRSPLLTQHPKQYWKYSVQFGTTYPALLISTLRKGIYIQPGNITISCHPVRVVRLRR